MVTVHGQPQGKARARVVRVHNRVMSFTPDKTRSYEDLIRFCYTQQGGTFHIGAAVQLTIRAYFQIPASWSQKKRSAAAGGGIPPTTKPDADNIAKIVSDALNGIAYTDDRQVIALTLRKHYSHEPRLEIDVLPLE